MERCWLYINYKVLHSKHTNISHKSKQLNEKIDKNVGRHFINNTYKYKKHVKMYSSSLIINAN